MFTYLQLFMASDGLSKGLIFSYRIAFSKSVLIFCRFSYIAICCLSLLHRLDKINVDMAVKYIISCKNLDGGFGAMPGGESHAGQSMITSIQ